MKMKKTHEIMSSSVSTEWYTPKWLFDKLNKEFNFTLDAASSDKNCLVKKHYTIEQDSLIQDWSNDIVFCNPPFNKNPKWFQKFANSGAKTTVVLCPIRAGTKYWFKYVYPYASEILIFNGRLKYENSINSPPFDSCLILWGKGSLQFLKNTGLILDLNKIIGNRG